MYLAPLSCAFVLCSLIGLMDTVTATVSADYPGVIELVGFSNRRARTHYIPPDESQQQSKIKMAADIETVKQNIKKYNSLLKMDTKNLPESQKEILERIVERVARLKESLDINQDNSTNSNESLTEATESQETTISSRQMTSSEMGDSSSFSASSSSEDTTTKNPDTTTTDDDQLMMSTADEEDYSMTNQDVKNDDDFAAKELPDEELALVDEANTDIDAAATSDIDQDGEIPTSTIGSDEMDDDQFVAARSNNNNHRTLVSTSNTIGKTKARPISTKRPGSSSTKSSASTLSMKRVNGQKPATMIGSASKPTTSYSLGSATTVQPTIVKIQKPLVQQKEPETMMKVQHQLPQKQQQQPNKLQNYQQEQDAASTSPVIQQQQQQQIEQKTVSPVQQTVQIQQRTPILGGGGISSSGSMNTAGSSIGSDVLYDSNVNASSIIDSLNNNAREEFYNKGGVNNKDKKPSATAKPTKYHYYPHNQHIYLLPECAIQQVCNAVYVRLNYTQPLCACPSRYRDPCSASLNEDDQHTTKLVGDGKKKAITLAKTCEATTEMRECRSPKDWSLLALQNTRTGKSHYLVICRCPDHFKMEGPMAHDQPTYASVPGIRVFGMMCVKPGYSVRKPSAQPPKRYQLQKPYYIPSSQNKYSSIKDHSRPSYTSSSSSSSSLGGASSLNYQPQHHHNLHQQDNFQSQHQANYQYLNRPDSGSSHFISSSNSHNNHNNHNDFPESISFSGSIYGRNNERNGEKPIPAAEEDSTSTSLSSSSSSSSSPSSSSSSPISSATKPEEISRTTAEIEAATTTLDAASKRDKRSIRELASEEDSTPEFPWQRAIEFQRSIVWD